MSPVFLHIALGMLITGLFISLVRLLRGPELQDRIVALDLFASLASGIILVIGLFFEESRYMDIVLVLSIILFLGTVAIARFLNKEKRS